MLTIDLHMHSKFSDGKLTISQLIDLYGTAGYDAIAVTDHLCATDSVLGLSAKFFKITLNEKNWHEYFREIEKQKNRAWREYKMIVYAGMEFTRNTFSHGRNAHLLALDLKDYISPHQSEEGWLREARQQNALTVAAHPMKVKEALSQTYYLLSHRNIFEPLIDVWEVANGRTFWREMLKTPYALIASSDLHHSGHWASWRTQISCDKDPEAIKAHLKDVTKPRSYAFISGHVNEVSHRWESAS